MQQVQAGDRQVLTTSDVLKLLGKLRPTKELSAAVHKAGSAAPGQNRIVGWFQPGGNQ